VLALLDRALPESPLLFRSPAIAENHRQGDLALAEVVADILAEILRASAVVERVIHQLEREAQVRAVGLESSAIVFGRARDDRTDFRRRREQRRSLGLDHLQILVL